MKGKKIICPYCHSTAVLRDASYVYKKPHGGKLYVCSRYPACDSYVGVHQGTDRPKGTLANAALRRRRIQAHQMFDQIWKRGIMSKPEAYRWLADKFALNSRQAHIGMFSDYMCEQVMKESVKVLSSNHVPLTRAS